MSASHHHHPDTPSCFPAIRAIGSSSAVSPSCNVHTLSMLSTATKGTHHDARVILTFILVGLRKGHFLSTLLSSHMFLFRQYFQGSSLCRSGNKLASSYSHQTSSFASQNTLSLVPGCPRGLCLTFDTPWMRYLRGWCQYLKLQRAACSLPPHRPMNRGGRGTTLCEFSPRKSRDNWCVSTSWISVRWDNLVLGHWTGRRYALNEIWWVISDNSRS